MYSQATAGALSRNDAVTNACMQYACMAAIRQRPSQLLLGACDVPMLVYTVAAPRTFSHAASLRAR